MTHRVHDTQSAEFLQTQDGHSIYVIMKTMCLLGYHENDSVAAHAIGHMMYAVRLYIYIYIYNRIHIYIYIYI